MKLSIIVPTYNEEMTIRKIINALESVNYSVDHEIILVDDASVDRTRDKAILLRLYDNKRHIRFFRNRVNLGKGSSIRRGLKHALGDIVIVQDADMEYDPRDIPRLIRPIIEGRAKVVYGNRFSGSGSPGNMALPNLLANRLLTWVANSLYRAGINDVSCCYKAIEKSLLRSLSLRSNRFEFCFEVTAKIRKKGIEILELPVSYSARTKQEGKKIGYPDFFHALWTLVKYKFLR